MAAVGGMPDASQHCAIISVTAFTALLRGQALSAADTLMSPFSLQYLGVDLMRWY